MNDDLDLICLDSVTPQAVEWLWRDRIPLGKVTILYGDPDVGKSLTTLDITARVSTGFPWPDSPCTLQEPGGVVLLSAEDDAADTIRPRLDAMGANCSRIMLLRAVRGADDKARQFNLRDDIERLGQAIDKTPNCKLATIDPISAYLGKTKAKENAEVRATLAPLAALAAEKHVAIVAVTHMNKSQVAAMYRALDSIAFMALSRQAWLFCRDEADREKRLMLPVKHNLAPDSISGLAFKIMEKDGQPTVRWLADEVVTIEADEALQHAPKRKGPKPLKLQTAIAWLQQSLRDAPRLVSELIVEADEDEGIKSRTLERAAKALGVIDKREGFQGKVWWCLPCQVGEFDSRQETESSTGENEKSDFQTCQAA
jgi:hypothetical protein